MNRSESIPVTRVAICDDHPIVREGFRQLIEADGTMLVEREFGTVAEVLAEGALRGMDVLVLDLSLPDGEGLEVLDAAVRDHPALKVVVLSMHDSPSFARDALARGASGFVSKGAGADELPAALAAAMRWEVYLSTGLAERLAEDGGGQADAGADTNLPALTAREHAVFVRLAQGESASEIAQALGISKKTVYNHRLCAMQKLGARSPVELHQIARRHGLIG
ncbi:MAG: response regulator [Lysobacteraceae bacterium]